MEANLEAYLAQKGIEYEKITGIFLNQIKYSYILERFVEFDASFDFMESTISNKNKLLGNIEKINYELNELNKNNINHKEVLELYEDDNVYILVFSVK